MIAAERGFSVADITARLLDVNEKAKTDGTKYAERTARRAIESVDKKKGGQ